MEELTGDQRGLVFRRADLTGGRFSNVMLRDVIVRDAELIDVTFDGVELSNVVINGVDIEPLVTAELDRREPERVLMRPTDPDGFRRAWDLLDERWAQTVARARSLPPDALHESVEGEWSFVQTLRHLLYATDIWLRRVVQGDPRPWHPLDLPCDGLPQHPEVPWDRGVRPALDEVLALRADRRAGVREYLAGLDEATLDSVTTPVDGPGWPPARAYEVREALLTVLNEEWEHRRFAERDLSVLGVADGPVPLMDWEFAGEVFEWRGPAPYYFVETPPDADAYLHDNLTELSFGWGCMRARVRVGSTEISTVLIPKDDVYLVPLKVALRRAEDFDDGDTVHVHLTVGRDLR